MSRNDQSRTERQPHNRVPRWLILPIVLIGGFLVSACGVVTGAPQGTPTPNHQATEIAHVQATRAAELRERLEFNAYTVTPVPSPRFTPEPLVKVSPTEIVERLRNTVVRIKTTTGMGSGTIFSPDGYILTNWHVIEGHGAVEVVVLDKGSFTGQVLGYNENLDIAVVKIAGDNWPYLAITTSLPRVGNEVFLYGYALDLEGDGSLTSGLVSAIREGKHLTWIQTDAAMNPGNSGGAALNSSGEFIGIPTIKIDESWGVGVDNLGFLVSLSSVAEEIPALSGGAKVALAPSLATPTATSALIPTPASDAQFSAIETSHRLRLYFSQQYDLAVAERVAMLDRFEELRTAPGDYLTLLHLSRGGTLEELGLEPSVFGAKIVPLPPALEAEARWLLVAIPAVEFEIILWVGRYNGALHPVYTEKGLWLVTVTGIELDEGDYAPNEEWWFFERTDSPSVERG